MSTKTFTTELSAQWIASVHQFMPTFLAEHSVLREWRSRMSVLLHGSTTMGIVDETSDIDLWLLLSREDIAALDAQCGTRFIGFSLDGKKGHLNAWDIAEFAECVRRCDMDTIYQLRLAHVIADHSNVGRDLIEIARRPMPEEVGEALFCYHYVEMRGEHRGCDSPIMRNQPMPLFFFLAKTLAHALRAAMVLDGEPYPYDKWLHDVAVRTETGRLLAPHVDVILNLLAQDHLRTGGPEASHPIAMALRAIRTTLIHTAQAKGLDAPWLTEWWLYMVQARAGITNLRWY